jgi:IS605 OrfB family transposase
LLYITQILKYLIDRPTTFYFGWEKVPPMEKREAELTVPGFILGLNGEVERLMLKFGNARRRAYSMKQKGMERLEIIRTLREETGLPVRYVWTAYEMVKDLPPHVTFGGKELQRLRENGEISKEEYRLRRNNLLACLGQACFRGNLCLRVEGDKLRVNVGPREWIHLPLLIPQRYEGYKKYLDGSKSYTVLLRRRDDKSGYDVKIAIEVETPEIPEPKRVMALDLNAGHIDFAVVEKKNLKPVAFGRINCHELLTSRKGKNRAVIYKAVRKIGNIARHYNAEVVAGRLRTASTKSRRANKKIHRMSHFRLRQVMGYKLPLGGVRFSERSEAYTSKAGEKLSKPFGLDIHKASAYAFAVKVIDYPTFMFLRGVPLNEGDGSPSTGLSGGSGLTAPCQANCLTRDEASLAEATPQFMGWGGGFEPFQPTVLRVEV